MKRKQAMRPVNGPICNYMSREDLNRIQNGVMLGGVSPNNPVNVYRGTDYSYKRVGGSASQVFRKQFNMLSDEVYLGDYEVFRVGVLSTGIHEELRPVYFFYGYRVVLEYFDVNAIADFTGPIEDGADLENAVRHFLSLYGKRFNVKRLNEHLINIKAL